NDDLQARYGNDWAAYYKHYLTYGIEEGRSISGIKPADMTAPVYPESSKPGGDQGGNQGGNQGGTSDKDPVRKPGDVNGDGTITVTDMIQIKSHILKKTTLTGAEAKAADISGDGAITITDFIQVKSRILGKN
ncbi:MAG: dockerin type I repeat-containing protein, partial [Agathobacter sp.]|nr:dockerin type I repeat-containing protein [Agathobacter sp.]